MSVDRRDSAAALTGNASYPSLRGRSVFITGGGSGIGGVMTAAFAAQGSLVAFVDINEQLSQTLVQKIEKAGHPRPWFRKVDVTDVGALQAAIRDAATALGDFHVLVNNVANDERHNFQDVTSDYYDDRIAVNQKPMFFATQAVVPGMKKKSWGRIVNIASAHALVASPFKSAYVAAKHGIAGLTKTAALELAEHGITVNAVCPGYVMTPLVEKQIPEQAKARGITEQQVISDVLLAAQPTKRFVTVEELSALVNFLCTDHARSITGTALPVDGGWTAH